MKFLELTGSQALTVRNWEATTCVTCHKVFNRPGVAGAVLQTPLYLINYVNDKLTIFLKYL